MQKVAFFQLKIFKFLDQLNQRSTTRLKLKQTKDLQKRVLKIVKVVICAVTVAKTNYSRITRHYCPGVFGATT